MKYTLLKVIIFFLALILIWFIYYSEYNIKNDNGVLIKAGIENFINKDINIVKTQEKDNILFAYFTFRDNKDSGLATLYRGINGLYLIKNAHYSNQSPFGFKIYNFKKGSNSYYVLYGENNNFKINLIGIQYENTSLKINVENENHFIKIYKDKKYSPFYKDIKLYDNNGTDITKQIADRSIATHEYSTASEKAETFIIYIYIGMVILILAMLEIYIYKLERRKAK